MRADATAVYVFDRGFVTRDDRGVALRMAGAMQDITEKKKLESRLLLADHMASMGTLAAGVAHEINNPLAYIYGNLEYVIGEIGNSLALDPSIRDALVDARLGAARVRDIVRDLKTFSRPNDETSGAVEIDAVVSSSASIAMNEIRHRARLVLKLGNPPAAAGTEARIGQVVLNLLVNAAQAIRVGAVDRNEIRVETGLDADNRVFIEVADTGSGMSPETTKQIFDPFFTTKPPGIGTGLGLPLCHTIVAGLGGEISVETEVGRGTTMRVTLP